ncbi:SDR family oxidoreductase, partial [Blautia schinkii]
SSGIGKGIADKFLREGHHDTGIDCNKSAIQHTAYRHICMDISDKVHYPELGPFDRVINNAGVQNNNDIDVNLKGTIDITEKYGIHPGIRAVLMIVSASGHN